MFTKYIHSIPSFTLSIYLYPPTGTHLQTGPVLLCFPSFFQHILIAQEGFTLVFYRCIYCTLIKVTSSFSFSFSIVLLPSYSTAVSVFHYTIVIHIILYSHFLSCLPIVPLDRSTLEVMFSTFFGYINWSGSHGSSMFSFPRNLHTVFQNVSIKLHSYQQCMEVSLLHSLISILLFFVFLMVTIVTGVELFYTVVLIVMLTFFHILDGYLCI
jgi:hypothetical protein